MIQFICVIVTIAWALQNKKPNLLRMEHWYFPNTPEEAFNAWKEAKLKDMYYMEWAGWKLLLISIGVGVLSLASEGIMVIGQISLLVAFVVLLVKETKAAGVAKQLEKQYGFKILKNAPAGNDDYKKEPVQETENAQDGMGNEELRDRD